MQLLTGVSGRGLVSQPVSKMVVHPMGMLVEMSSDMPNTSFSSIALAFLLIGLRTFFFIVHLLWLFIDGVVSVLYPCKCGRRDNR
jgi:hypothetical protein